MTTLIQTRSTKTPKVINLHTEVFIFKLLSAGQIYFIRGWHLREFGFPRDKDVNKIFKWKKMNFTTDLPKNNPLCTYLVASAKHNNEFLRMHVVALFPGKDNDKLLQICLSKKEFGC